MNKLQQLIRESIGDYMNEIDKAGEVAGYKSRMEATQAAIEKRKNMTNIDELDEDRKSMIDPKRVKEISSEMKSLEKYLAKLQKQLDKLESKLDKSSKVETEEEKEIVDETMMDENNPENGPQLEEEYDTNIYEMLHMQKLAGILSETEYKVKVEEAKKKKASAGMTKKEKSELAKKAHAGKDIGKKGPGFKKVEKTAEKEYGSKEAGKKVAAAAMWKSAAKKAKSLKEEVLALFENEGNEDIASFLNSNLDELKNWLKKSIGEPNYVDNIKKMIPESDGVSAVTDIEMLAPDNSIQYSFRFPQDVDNDFYSDETDPEKTTIAGKDIMYIYYYL